MGWRVANINRVDDVGHRHVVRRAHDTDRGPADPQLAAVQPAIGVDLEFRDKGGGLFRHPHCRIPSPAGSSTKLRPPPRRTFHQAPRRPGHMGWRRRDRHSDRPAPRSPPIQHRQRLRRIRLASPPCSRCPLDEPRRSCEPASNNISQMRQCCPRIKLYLRSIVNPAWHVLARFTKIAVHLSQFSELTLVNNPLAEIHRMASRLRRTPAATRPITPTRWCPAASR